MANEYTPTTGEVRAFYVAGIPPHRASVPEGNAEFDRWHASEVAAAEKRGAVKALRSMADELASFGVEPWDRITPAIRAILIRMDQIEAEPRGTIEGEGNAG